MQPADRAWLTLAAGVIAWDVVCPHDEMLSDASARYTKNHPLAWGGLVIYIAGHLIHVWPRRVDPLSVISTTFGR